MPIQWFPGHTASPRKKAAEAMERTDVIIEVLDARLPEASCNPLIRELREYRQRPCLKILNKSDLADPAVTKAWLDYYNRLPGVKAVALSCKKPGDAAKVPGLCAALAPHRGTRLKPLRMMIMGIPNVGKSTRYNQKIDIAVCIEVPGSNGANKVDANEVLHQPGGNFVYKDIQHFPKLGIRMDGYFGVIRNFHV